MPKGFYKDIAVPNAHNFAGQGEKSVGATLEQNEMMRQRKVVNTKIHTVKYASHYYLAAVALASMQPAKR